VKPAEWINERLKEYDYWAALGDLDAIYVGKALVALQIALEALEFMTMPLNEHNITLESLLHTVKIDESKGREVLKEIKEILK